MIRWQLGGLLDGQVVNASWDDQTGLDADAPLFDAVVDLIDQRRRVQATPTGPGFTAGIATSDPAWATVRAAMDAVTDQFGMPDGYPWGVPEGAVDG